MTQILQNHTNKVFLYDTSQGYLIKGNTILKAHYRQMFLKCLYSEADCLFTAPSVSQI